MEPQKRKSILIFTDGASSGNPGPGGWGAILVSPNEQVLEIGGHEKWTTNNRMELSATIESFQRLYPLKSDSQDPIELCTDSTYVIRGATQWIKNWKKRGWKSAEGNEVANRDLWEKLSHISQGLQINWRHVRGHSGVPGNERADEIAVQFSRREPPSLYCGPLNQYPIQILSNLGNSELPPMKPQKTQTKAHSYLSLIGNTPKRHLNWIDCEARVRGQSGAKFKKAMTPAEEIKILHSWGFKPQDLL